MVNKTQSTFGPMATFGDSIGERLFFAGVTELPKLQREFASLLPSCAIFV